MVFATALTGVAAASVLYGVYVEFMAVGAADGCGVPFRDEVAGAVGVVPVTPA